MPVPVGSSPEQSHLQNIKKYAVGGLNGLYYIPNYLEPCQQDSLLENIRSSKSRWTQVTKQHSNSLHAILRHAICVLAALKAAFSRSRADNCRAMVGLYMRSGVAYYKHQCLLG